MNIIKDKDINLNVFESFNNNFNFKSNEIDKKNALTYNDNKISMNTLDNPNILLTGHEDEIICCNFSNQGNLLCSGGLDKNIFLWDINKNGKNINLIKNNKGFITDIKWNKTDEFIYTSSSDFCINLWDINLGKKLRKWKKEDSIINCLAINKKGKDVICSGNDLGIIRLWNNNAKESIKEIDLGIPILSLECDNYLQNLFIGTVDNKILNYDLRIEKFIYYLDGHNDSISSLKLNKNNNSLLSLSFDETMNLWDLNSRKSIGNFSGFFCSIEKNLFGCDISFDNKYISCGSSDGLLNIYNTINNKLIYKLEGHNGYINDISFSNNSYIIASCSNDKKIILTDLNKIN